MSLKNLLKKTIQLEETALLSPAESFGFLCFFYIFLSGNNDRFVINKSFMKKVSDHWIDTFGKLILLFISTYGFWPIWPLSKGPVDSSRSQRIGSKTQSSKLLNRKCLFSFLLFLGIQSLKEESSEKDISVRI